MVRWSILRLWWRWVSRLPSILLVRGISIPIRSSSSISIRRLGRILLRRSMVLLRLRRDFRMH